MNTEQVTKFLALIKSQDLVDANPQEGLEEDLNVKMPLFWGEDANGNINFDIDSIRQMCESLIDACEEYNAESEFDFDNC